MNIGQVLEALKRDKKKCREKFQIIEHYPGLACPVFCDYAHDRFYLLEEDPLHIAKNRPENPKAFYIAADLESAKRYALFCYKEEPQREADLLMRLNGKQGFPKTLATCPKVAMGEGSYGFVILQEYYPRGNLAHFINELESPSKTARTIQERDRIAEDCLKALIILADEGIVHTDIRPENILLTNEGDALIADLGSAIQTGDISNLKLEERSGLFPPNLAPELREAQATESADVWALGVVFYFLYRDLLNNDFQRQMNLFLTATWMGKGGSREVQKPVGEDSLEYLIWKMMRPNPNDRISAKEALEKFAS